MPKQQPMTMEELLALPPAIDIPTAGKAIGVSRGRAYQMVKNDEWPFDDIPVLKIGKRFKIPTAALLKYLGVQPHNGHTTAATSDGGSSNTSAMRRPIDPERWYRLRPSGEVVIGAEILRRRAARGES
ncbi:hypothetical protein LWC35_18180 [Pseudonocardia kujensis]|uniref:hypothetical protein n=1 Tax=Pseudonocardia kujensis TaxID=1128675 RepID=UPI001E30296C|nr:hypothetical protein [Pseudonocardia kujensis]MCE0764819.1 hypothetical protein [Pseudonocardia kujensis]